MRNDPHVAQEAEQGRGTTAHCVTGIPLNTSSACAHEMSAHLQDQFFSTNCAKVLNLSLSSLFSVVRAALGNPRPVSTS